MTEPPIRGSCLCGRTVFEVTPPFLKFVHCHCSRCRKSSGASHATNIAVRTDQLAWIAGDDGLEHFRLPSAARFGKSFCRACGCPMPRRLPGTDLVVIPAGSLDDAIAFTPSEHLFWDSRPAWGCPSGGLPAHDGASPA